MKRGLVKYLLESLCLGVFFCGVVLASASVSADDNVVDEINVTVSSSCTLAGVGMDSHVATLYNAQYSGDVAEYENGIGKTTLTAFCNDYDGFSIYAIGFTGDSYDSPNHTKLVGVNGGATIDTALHNSTDTTSSWAMKLTKVTDGTVAYVPANMAIVGGFDDWHVVPATYTKVAQYHANTGSSATDTVLGGKLETTYAVYASATQEGDTYEGKVKYVLVHPYTEEPLQPQTTASGKICYYANASDAEGTMGCQTIPTSGTTNGVSPTSATLLASNFSRTGYGFAGWSDKFDYVTNNEAKFYGPQETITYENGQYVGEGKGLSLYAVWIKSAGNLQDTTKVAELCGTGTNALTTALADGTANLKSVSALTDQRDSQTYAIAKLADGKCWMIENLRLDNSASLTLANTNNPLNDGTNVTLKHSYSDTETYSTLSASQDPTATAWCNSNRASCDDQPMLFAGNTTNRASSPTANGAAMYSYGNYYNWYSATAGRGTYSFGTLNDSVAGDLCPAGWHLPKGGNKSNEVNNEFWSLVVTGINGGTNPANYESSTSPYYTGIPEGPDASNKLRAYPNNFVYSGDLDGRSVGGRGSYGDFWSSTAISSNHAYSLHLYSSYVVPGANNINKYYGGTVRCVVSGV